MHLYIIRTGKRQDLKKLDKQEAIPSYETARISGDRNTGWIN